MKIGPKYKIARRVGAPIFEKTQTQKYALSEERKFKRKRERPKTDYGLQLVEKQKARMFYGVTEKQFKNYVKSALSKKGIPPVKGLLSALESRLDNVVWRIGLAPTHGAARQMVSHGHIIVNTKKVKIPSFSVSEGDAINIRLGSQNSPLFKDPDNLSEKLIKETPSWISFDPTKKEAVIKAGVSQSETELMFDLGQVIEFYQR